MNRAVVTITGPSGSGKSTLEAELVDVGFSKVVSTTTREPREGEIDGVDYYFVTKDEFATLILSDMLVEMVEFKGNMYAVENRELERVFATGNAAVIVCEPSGAQQVDLYCSKNNVPLLKTFVTNNLNVLVERFLRRELVNSDMVNVGYLTTRIINLISKEVEWLNEQKWDVVFDRYDDDNKADVIGFIESHVELRAKVA